MVTAGKAVWPKDLNCVDVRHEEELLYWSARLGVSTCLLRQAVRIVGNQLDDVALFLKSRTLPGGPG